MPSKPNFHASLPLPDGSVTRPDGKRRGPHAGGLIEEDDELLWVYVWIIQNGEEMTENGEMTGNTWAAAADGESPDGTTFTGEWAVETHLTDGSDEFSDKIAAVGTAMALIKRGNNSPYVYWWTDAVNFKREPATAA
jgi:hypothetical protein